MSSKYDTGFISEPMALLLIGIEMLLVFIIFYTLVYKKGFDFNRTGRIISVFSIPIACVLLVIANFKSIVGILVTIIISAVVAYLFWPAYYEQFKNMEWVRESMRAKHGEKHTWVNKMTYLPNSKNEPEHREARSLNSEDDQT